MSFFISKVEKTNLKILFFGSDAACNLKTIISCRITVKSQQLQKTGNRRKRLCSSCVAVWKRSWRCCVLRAPRTINKITQFVSGKKKKSAAKKKRNTRDKTKNSLVHPAEENKTGKQNNREKFTSPLCNLLLIYVTAAVVVCSIRDVHAHISPAGSVPSAGTRSVVSPTKWHSASRFCLLQFFFIARVDFLTKTSLIVPELSPPSVQPPYSRWEESWWKCQ